MASSFSDLLRLELMATGENENTWGDKTNNNLDKLEQSIAGRVALVAASSDITLTTAQGGGGPAEQAANMILDVTGTLTANVNIIAPNVSKVYLIRNATVQTVSETLSIKTSAGAALQIPNGDNQLVWCDGANNFYPINANVSGTVPLATNALQLGGVVAASYAQLAVKQSFLRPQRQTPVHVTLTSNAYTPDADVDSHVIVDQSELGAGTLTINNPTGTPFDGQILQVDVEQRTVNPADVTWGSKFIFANDTNVGLTQTINKVDTFAFQYSSNLDRWIAKGIALNFPRA